MLADASAGGAPTSSNKRRSRADAVNSQPRGLVVARSVRRQRASVRNMRKILSATTALDADALDRTITHYGACVRASSSAALSGLGAGPSTMSRQDSFADLPLVALPGLTSRVSISGMSSSMSASQADLPEFFRRASFSASDLAELGLTEVQGGWTLPLVLSLVGALMPALLFGFNNGNMNTPALVMRAALGISAPAAGCVRPDVASSNDALWGFCVSGFCLSALVGSAAGGPVADHRGRRAFLRLNTALYVAAGLLEASAGLVTCDAGPDPCVPAPCVPGLLLLLLGRVIVGIACGGSTVVCPMYLGEIAPAHLRGTIGAAFLLTAVTGMLFAQLLGLPAALGTPSGWPWMLVAGLLPAAAFQLATPALVESPRWLLQCGRSLDARDALAKLRGCDADDPEMLRELDAMQPGAGGAGGGGGGGAALKQPLLAAAAPTYGVAQLLRDRSMRRPLYVCVTLMVVQQFSGINNAFNYSSTFLKMNGLGDDTITTIAIAMNCGNVLVVLLSSVLMDRLGRRTLLLLSIGGMAAASALLTAALLLGSTALVCAAILLFVVTFGLGLGPVAWLLPAELFPMGKRAAANGVATGANWLANFAVGQLFLLVAGALGPLAFIPFGAILAAGFLFAWRFIPETRGRTLEQIEAMMRKER